ncbi:gag/pol protein [Cucumis melo var. makuwa]|uniref:Gag/pol protein n=1 Tax=Cucumis melo var. makuwa TaxID=1194695 RepID=A0A5D3DWF1_CUCMM|nr:gag/pol protein [Cucumis melo var. makuwa]TYK27769.1 gag/pol protein [Cucumis melo var. makuwa]
MVVQIDEANQVSFILESLSKSFIPFQTNASLNKIEFNLTILLNELQRFQNLTKGKGKEVEANVATTKRKFKRGSSSKSKVGPSKSNRKIEKKGKGKTPKQNKGKKTAEEGKCYHCGKNGHWLRNCPKYLARKKAEKKEQGKCDLLFLETSSWKMLSEGEITLKVGTGEMVSAKAVGDLKLFFNDRYIILKNVLIGRLVKSGLLSQLEDNSLPLCDSCLEGKMTKRSFIGKGLRAKMPLGLVHSDLCGPMNVKAWGGYEYFITFIDDYSRYGHVYLIQNKFDSFEKFKEYKAEVENESETAVYILNNIPSKRVSETPYELWKGRKAQIIIPDDGIEDPLTYEQAMNDVDCDQWIKSMDLEMESMYSNSVWTLVEQPNDVKPIGCKWIYKRKRDQAGKTQTFKARLVANGYTQKEGIDYEETFSPVAMIKSIRILLSIATFYDYEIWQMDVKTAFLNEFQKGSVAVKYGIHLSKEQCPTTPQKVKDMSNISYASTVGSLMYAMLCTRPDICYSVGIVSRYQSSPRRDHWKVVKNILKYLRRRKDYMLVYGSKDLILTGYTDSDFQTDKDVRKFTLGSVFTLNGGAVFLTDLEVVPNMQLPITLYCDNSGAAANSREPRSHKRGKHIERKYHLIREIVHRGDVIITKISSEQNMANPFTKALKAKVFESHLHGLGLRGL